MVEPRGDESKDFENFLFEYSQENSDTENPDGKSGETTQKQRNRESILHVNLSRTASLRPDTKVDIFLKTSPSTAIGDPTFVELKKVTNIKHLAQRSMHYEPRSPRGFKRLGLTNAIFILETTAKEIPFYVEPRDHYFHVINEAGHPLFYGLVTAKISCCSMLPTYFKIDVLEFDGSQFCHFDMERILCRFYTRMHAPGEKFGTIRHCGCSLRYPTFKVRNRNFRLEFLALPYKSSCRIPEEYIVLGLSADKQVARLGKQWQKSEFPIILQRSIDADGGMYGIVFDEPLKMFQKLILLGLVLAVKCVRKDFVIPPDTDEFNSV